MVHVEPRSIRVYEDINLAWSHSYFDSDLERVGRHCIGNDEEEATDDIECSQLGGLHLTEADLLADDVAVQWGTERAIDQGSNDSLSDCASDED